MPILKETFITLIIGQWNQHGKPKKVVFTMKDELYSLVYYYKNQKLLETFISFISFLMLLAFYVTL